ncbi:competence/damage-inducible protein A [Leptolyngbya sp. 7M]|nr:competence/damage-inducible protein A [Leptolyngbya sp. 7M]QYO65161.1 competence/damage-inducible protein A [Leptolyngbya sp. 7M]
MSESNAAEVISVGTELLLGEILNTNAQFLAQELARLGIPHYYQTVVGDNILRLQKAVAIGCERSRLLIFTGGLGPTPDDLTTEALADFFQARLIERAEILEDIAQKFARRGRQMSPSNRKQALIPEGAEVLPNPTGSAPGMIWQPRPGLTILTFPGVPSEMQVMWRETAVPFLLSQGWGEAVIYSRTLRFWGIAESTLAEKVSAQLALPNPTVAPYAGKGEVRLRISAKAKTEAEATQLIAPIAQQIQETVGLDYYGSDDDTLASVVGALLKQANQTVAVAESCTGGGLGHPVFNQTIVSHMHVGHQQVVVADDGGFACSRSPVDRDIFPNQIVIPNLHQANGSVVLQILGFKTDRRTWKNLIASTNFRPAVDHRMVTNDRTGTHLDPFSDHRISANLHGGMQFCTGMNHGGGMNQSSQGNA